MVEDVLQLLDPGALGLSRQAEYQVQDLLAHRFVDCHTLAQIPITLRPSQPQVVLIEPRRDAPRIAHFTGVDAATEVLQGHTMVVTISGAAGSPLALYIDAGSAAVTRQTPGFAVERLVTGLWRVTGAVPAGKTITLTLDAPP